MLRLGSSDAIEGKVMHGRHLLLGVLVGAAFAVVALLARGAWLGASGGDAVVGPGPQQAAERPAPQDAELLAADVLPALRSEASVEVDNPDSAQDTEVELASVASELELALERKLEAFVDFPSGLNGRVLLNEAILAIQETRGAVPIPDAEGRTSPPKLGGDIVSLTTSEGRAVYFSQDEFPEFMELRRIADGLRVPEELSAQIQFRVHEAIVALRDQQKNRK